MTQGDKQFWMMVFGVGIVFAAAVILWQPVPGESINPITNMFGGQPAAAEKAAIRMSGQGFDDGEGHYVIIDNGPPVGGGGKGSGNGMFIAK